MPYSSVRKAKSAIPEGKANSDCATTKNVIKTVDIAARMRLETIPARETLISPVHNHDNFSGFTGTGLAHPKKIPLPER